MLAISNIDNQKFSSSSVTYWEEEGTIVFSFEENTIINTELVFNFFDEFILFGKYQEKNMILLDLEGVIGATLEGLSLLNQKLESFCLKKAILVNDKYTDIIGRIFTNFFNHNRPTRVFKSALEADVWINE